MNIENENFIAVTRKKDLCSACGQEIGDRKLVFFQDRQVFLAVRNNNGSDILAAENFGELLTELFGERRRT